MVDKENFAKDINVPRKEQIIDFECTEECLKKNTNECYGLECIVGQENVLKQLARKTQECEELKKQLIQKDEINTFFNTPIEGWSSDPCNVCEYKGENTRYRKALEEIEEFLNITTCNICKDEPSNVCEECNVNRIKDIINKAKGEGKCQ